MSCHSYYLFKVSTTNPRLAHVVGPDPQAINTKSKHQLLVMCRRSLDHSMDRNGARSRELPMSHPPRLARLVCSTCPAESGSRQRKEPSKSRAARQDAAAEAAEAARQTLMFQPCSPSHTATICKTNSLTCRYSSRCALREMQGGRGGRDVNGAAVWMRADVGSCSTVRESYPAAVDLDLI